MLLILWVLSYCCVITLANEFPEFWEFLGIPNNSKFEGNCLWNLWELLGIAKTPMRIYRNSEEFSIIPKILKSLLTWERWLILEKR